MRRFGVPIRRVLEWWTAYQVLDIPKLLNPKPDKTLHISATQVRMKAPEVQPGNPDVDGKLGRNTFGYSNSNTPLED